jgi:hypothetical protein
MNPFKAFTVVAGISAAGSLLTVVLSLTFLTLRVTDGGRVTDGDRITDGGMWAIAAMAAAPAVMGIGVSYFISRTPSGVPWGSKSKGAEDNDLQ